ncbi:glycogen synthase [bacterium BMS3Abin15]|nr:glycogen synthase [bacterium BMS3Abin15]
MKILEINKFHFAKGGADKHFLDVISLLENQGHEVAVFSMRHSKNSGVKQDNYFVSTVGYTQEYSLWEKLKGAFRMFHSFEAKKKINELLDDFQPDIAHIHNIYHQLSPAILFEIKKRNIPIVMTVHDYKLINPNYNLYSNGKSYDRCRDKKYYQCFLDRCVKNSYLKSFLAMLEMYWHESLGTYGKNIDIYIAPSEFAKRTLVEWGMDHEKIIVLPHFINKELAITAQADGEKYALYYGRISKEKGVADLMSIFENLNSKTKLYMAGEIENNFKIRESENIKYLGYLDKNELMPYIKKTDFVVSASKLPETFGLVALESISQGKPFIGLRNGAYPEIIKNGINGFLVGSKNELRNVISKMIKNELVFNSQKIQKLAYEKYNKADYYSKLISIFQR